MPRRKTREEFISDAIEVHGDKYDYSQVEYINNKIFKLINFEIFLLFFICL